MRRIIRRMLATHSGIYDALLMELIVLALLGLLALAAAVRLYRQSGRLRPPVLAMGLLALVPLPAGVWAAQDARFRNRCVEHNSDIALCQDRQLPDPGPATEWAPPPPPAPLPPSTRSRASRDGHRLLSPRRPGRERRARTQGCRRAILRRVSP